MVVLYGQCSGIACIKRNSSSLGKVLVHCLMGMSRSATLVLAFLMKKENMTVVEAFKQVLLSRDIRPNDGFIKQLAEYQY